MSWGQCLNGSNNIHFDFPPIMADGRNYATWQPGAKINDKIREDNNIKTNNEYRKFLINNADNVIKANQLEACNECCYCPVENSNVISNSPFLYKSCLERSQPYGYETSDLKNLYLSRQQLQCRMVAPSLTQDQYLQQKYPNPN